jgi:hypothetical protein
MSRVPSRRGQPHLEILEKRVALSSALPANTIGTTVGSVNQAGEISHASVAVAGRNLTPDKPSTLFGVFVQPQAGSRLAPRIIAVEGNDGQRLPINFGRPFIAGRDSGQAAAFVKVNEPGALTVLVAGRHKSTGSYMFEVTLAGDVDGDGVVNLADLRAFAPTYMASRGEPNYNSAADFNQNGIINLYDAKALMENMTPLTANIPPEADVHLVPADQAHYSASTNSGGSTFKRDVTIVGLTTPGSIVITDSTAQNYRFTGPAVATNADGFFAVAAKNSEGINNNDFLILDPFGHQLIRDFPIFWIRFAAPGSKLR